MEKAAVFFYGTFMSARVLNEHGIACDITHPAKLNGYELSIRPRVNLRRNPDGAAYGGVAEITHADIAKLYDGLREKFGITYHPFPVLVELLDGSFRPALCYISADIKDAPADPKYVDALAECAVQLQAPESYVQHIRSFLRPNQRLASGHNA